MMPYGCFLAVAAAAAASLLDNRSPQKRSIVGVPFDWLAEGEEGATEHKNKQAHVSRNASDVTQHISTLQSPEMDELNDGNTTP